MIQNLLWWSLIFMMIGASAYVTDCKLGVKLYTKIQKWWKPPIEGVPLVERGFIYNRSNKTRWKYAAILSGIWIVIMIGWRHEDPRTEIIVMFVLPFSTFIGFLIGPLYLRFKQTREELLTKLDEVESGKINLRKEVTDVAQEKLGIIEKILYGLIDRIGTFFGKCKTKKNNAQPVAPPSPPTNPTEDRRKAREAIDKFGK